LRVLHFLARPVNVFDVKPIIGVFSKMRLQVLSYQFFCGLSRWNRKTGPYAVLFSRYHFLASDYIFSILEQILHLVQCSVSLFYRSLLLLMGLPYLELGKVSGTLSRAENVVNCKSTAGKMLLAWKATERRGA